jgi:hypothetical protein
MFPAKVPAKFSKAICFWYNPSTLFDAGILFGPGDVVNTITAIYG